MKTLTDQNRTKLVPIFDREHTKWEYDNTPRQLGQTVEGPWIRDMVEDRGLLQLTERQSRIPGGASYVRPNWQYINGGEPFMSSLLDATKLEKRSSSLDTPLLTFTLRANRSVIATADPGTFPTAATGGDGYVCTLPDQAMNSTILEVLRNVGDIAHVLQSFVTMSSGLTYYDQRPQFYGEASTNQTMLIFVLTPVRHHGYMAVVVVFASSSGAYGCYRWAFHSRDKHLTCGKRMVVSSSSQRVSRRWTCWITQR